LDRDVSGLKTSQVLIMLVD